MNYIVVDLHIIEDENMTITPSDIIRIEIDEEARKRAEERADKKKNWFDTKEIRDTERRRYNFLMGQISEEAFRFLLVQNKKWYEYYDDVRTDNFSKADYQYDFLLKEKGKNEHTQVNVKSSILQEEYLTLEKGNLLAYPYQAKGINVQACVEGDSSTNTLSNTAYLFGWATKSEVVGTGVNKLNVNRGGGATHNLPLVRTHPIPDLLTMIL